MSRDSLIRVPTRDDLNRFLYAVVLIKSIIEKYISISV